MFMKFIFSVDVHVLPELKCFPLTGNCKLFLFSSRGFLLWSCFVSVGGWLFEANMNVVCSTCFPFYYFWMYDTDNFCLVEMTLESDVSRAKYNITWNLSVRSSYIIKYIGSLSLDLKEDLVPVLFINHSYQAHNKVICLC